MCPDPQRLALERALALAEEQVLTIRAALDGQPVPSVVDEGVPVKTAATIWNLDESSARKRAKRCGGWKGIDGRWRVPRSVLPDTFTPDDAR